MCYKPFGTYQEQIIKINDRLLNMEKTIKGL